MPIEWLGGGRTETVADLVARKKYGRAIELLRKRLQGQPTSTSLRLQLADVLVQAGRGPEAVPVFLGLADDFAEEGFLARAVAALKRIEKLEPGRPDVEARLKHLAREPAPPPLPLQHPGLGPSTASAATTALGEEEEKQTTGPSPSEAASAPVPPEADVSASDGEAGASDGGTLFTDTIPGPRPGLPDEDTNPKILLPGESEDAPPARRPRREPAPGEDFLSMPEDALQEQVEDLIEDLFLPPQGPLATAGPRSPAPPGEGGLAGLIFDEMAPEERLALMRGLRLRTYEPGDILVTEGEPPSGLYLVTAGGLRLHARDALGRNQEAGALQEGDFFGEVASLSGLPRHVTAVATAPGEMLVLDQDSMDQIALNHPRVWARMHAYARERAAGRKAAAPGEALAEGPGSEPRLRLRLVKAFLRAGKREEARRILLDLADELVRQGRSETAVALLRKIEQLGASAAGAGPAPPSSPPSGRVGSPVATDDQLGSWIKSLARDAPAHPEASRREPRRWVERLADPETLRAQAGLRGCRLFEGLGEEALLGFVQDLPLEERGAGEILLTEGEPSDSLLVVATGRVKVFVRQRSGRDGLLLELGEGAFLGEIGVLAGLPRTATATTAAPTLLLRVDRRSLERLCRSHPPARAVLEEALQARSTNPEESPVRDRTEHE